MSEAREVARQKMLQRIKQAAKDDWRALKHMTNGNATALRGDGAPKLPINLTTTFCLIRQFFLLRLLRRQD
jgi:hypothetical protein